MRFTGCQFRMINFSHKFLYVVLFFLAVNFSVYTQETNKTATKQTNISEKNSNNNLTDKEDSSQEISAKTETDKKQNEDEEFSRYFKKEYESEPTENIQKGKRVSWGWQLVKTSFGLLFIIGFFYLLVRLYRFQQNLPARYSQVIKPLHQYPITGGKQIQILELGNRLLVVAVSDAGIQLITEIHEKSEIDKIKLESTQYEEATPPDFLTELTKTLKQEWNKTKTSLSKDSTRDFSNFANTQDDMSVDWNAMRQSSQEKLNHLKQTREDFRNGDKNS